MAIETVLNQLRDSNTVNVYLLMLVEKPTLSQPQEGVLPFLNSFFLSSPIVYQPTYSSGLSLQSLAMLVVKLRNSIRPQ